MEKSLNIEEVKAFMQNVPEDRKVVANGLFDRLIYLNKLLSIIEKQIDEGNATIAPTIKSYNDTIQRYGIICKQLVSILPKPVENFENDPLLNFIKEGYKNELHN